MSPPASALILNPEGASMFVRFTDTPERLVASPRGLPIWFAAICLSVPFVALAVHLGQKVSRSALTQFDIIGLGMACLVLPTFLILIWAFNRHEAKRGDFFVLDKVRRTLTLPRLAIVLEPSQIAEFAEVCAWHEKQRLSELSVVTRTASGQANSYAVVTCQHRAAVRKAGTALAEFFGVELRAL